MVRNNGLFLVSLIVLFLGAAPATHANAGHGASPGTEAINSWLKTRAVPMPLAVLDEKVEVAPVSLALDAPPLDVADLWAAAGDKAVLAPGTEVKFRPTTELDFSPLPQAGSEAAHLAYAVTYLDNPAWQKGRLQVTGRAPFRLFLDGQKVCDRLAAATADTDQVSGDVTLDQGWRRLVLVTVTTAEDSLPNWSLNVNWETADSTLAPSQQPVVTTDPRHPFDFPDYWRQESVSSTDITRDGKFLATRISGWQGDQGDRTARLEVWDLKDRRRIWNFQGGSIQSFRWDPDGERLLIQMAADKGSDLYFWHRTTGLLERVDTGLEQAAAFTWAPDGQVIYYTRTTPREDDGKPYKTMWSLEDRWHGWRDNSEIWYYVPSTGTHRQLTAMTFGPDGYTMAPDGSFLVLKRSVSLAERPFMGTEIWTLDTRTGQARKVVLFRSYSVGDLALSPDGKQVAFAAPMDEVTGNLNTNPEHNDNQTDLWTLDLKSGRLRNHTRTFEPAIATGSYVTNRGGIVFWDESGKIGFSGLWNKTVKLYFYDPRQDRMEEHDLGTPGGSQFAASEGSGTTLVYHGDVLESPGDVWTLDWKRNRHQRLFSLSPDFRRLISGAPRIEDFDYVNSDGVTIPGFLFYPRNYDPQLSYPMVVDYYAGVFGFAGGFYWGSTVLANRGYFVYVPTPRGAAGWGQEFADTHPNDWGTLTSRDMNEGVRAIVSRVPGVDGARVAPVSGSYGGFMAMYLLSMDKDHPDYYPYATGISDYGISNLASYWGKGWWGYLYSDMATAGKYPWNDAPFYVDHSPLFQADNVTVPLLLVHGDADNNVPVSESDQMYTALKILGREVAFVRFPGEDHGIVGKRTSYLTSKRMHWEWFDKYLKDRPGAWEARMEGEFGK